MKVITDTTIHQIHRNLEEFGYSVTYEYVKGEVDLIAAGNRPKGIIGIFAKNMLEKNGYLKENDMTILQEWPDDNLLKAFDNARTRLEQSQDSAGMLEQEILRRMEERGARAIPSNTYACEGTQDNTYDQASLTPLKEVLNEADLTTVLTTGYQKVVWVPEKWATQKVLALARRLPEVQAIVDRARIEGRLKLKFEKREE